MLDWFERFVRDLDLDAVDWYQTLVISVVALIIAIIGYLAFFVGGAVVGGLVAGFVWGAGF